MQQLCKKLSSFKNKTKKRKIKDGTPFEKIIHLNLILHGLDNIPSDPDIKFQFIVFFNILLIIPSYE